MIDDYRALAVFATVAEGGGFAATARKLKLSTSVVSHHVSRLEHRLGVSLFFRSTRSISLTAEGVSLLPAAKRLVQAGNEAMDALVDNSDQPVGSLRVAMPAFFGEHPVTKRVWKFVQTNPMVAMTINMSEVEDELSDGGLVKVLPDWDLPIANAYAVWPAAAQQKNLTRLFINDIARTDLI